jgi:hypothetical protein
MYIRKLIGSLIAKLLLVKFLQIKIAGVHIIYKSEIHRLYKIGYFTLYNLFYKLEALTKMIWWCYFFIV